MNETQTTCTSATQEINKAVAVPNQLIQKHSHETVSISNRDLVIFFQQLENAISKHSEVETANYHPVAGRYFKVAEQHERNTSYLHKGKKEALQEALTSFQRQLPMAQRIALETARADLKTELFEIANKEEMTIRVNKIITEEARVDIRGDVVVENTTLKQVIPT